MLCTNNFLNNNLKSSTKLNTDGITSKLKKVEVISPPITATAIGERNDVSPALQPAAIGSIPAPMAMVVITIGLARLWQASISASKRFKPCSRCARIAYSTSKIEFLVAMPINMTKPMSDGIEKLLCATSKATKAPPKDSGKATNIVNGCKKSLNNSTKTI